MLYSYFQGFLVGLGLILAIGAQNAFVLKQGLKKQSVFLVCLVCALSDSILIAIGVLGFAKLISHYPQALVFAQYFGATFLLWYGAQHFYQAYSMPKLNTLDHVRQTKTWKIILICLAMTWLNPHVYLDTVMLIGAVSTQYESTKLYFALGAVTASWLFFFSLGYGARLLSPVFQSQKAWQVLDVIIGMVMWGIAISLLNMQL
ncbi:L-lysine exporter family protein LysE/ArgO [Acinetobacter calcoaceticus]|uniref:L-lysine exporter family protein LysE/ArgO n=1 Tax=Acinetobacter calcoaceticus TaxID=471 RepID=A0A4V2R1B8_ACICA|nr:L-lysine exporter family protein LysE/ArgO [Acinetobacter calcoaceticus]